MNETQHVPVHQQMKSRAILLTSVLFVLIVAGMFGFAYLTQKEQANQIDAVPDTATGENEGRFGYIDRIDGTHYYIDGVHTIVGEIPMPTPCDLLEGDVLIAESYPEQVTLNFSVINNAASCAQVVTPARFKLSATASEEATFNARLEGTEVPLNLTPAPEGETPDDFEIFIKG